MKIYFAGSIRGGQNDKELYSRIIKLLSGYGTVLTEHINNKDLSAMGENIVSGNIYERDIKWLTESDVVVAEVSTPSLGVGYEIAKAEEMSKRILCLYRSSPDRRLSAMIAGNKHVSVVEYQRIEELEKVLSDFFK